MSKPGRRLFWKIVHYLSYSGWPGWCPPPEMLSQMDDTPATFFDPYELDRWLVSVLESDLRGSGPLGSGPLGSGTTESDETERDHN